MIVPLLRYRSFIWHRAVNDLRHRYAGTGMGVVWNVVHPLAVIGVYALVFSTIMSARVPGVGGRFAYVLYLCAGFLPWLAFSEAVTRGAGAFVDNAAYLKKLPIPEQLFVASSAVSATLSLMISFTLLIGIALVAGQRPTWHWALLPLPLVSLQVMGLGLGLLLGTINVFLRDVGQLLAIALQVVFWTVPIVYTIDLLPAWAHGPLAWHPLVPPIEAVRDLFLHARLPPATTWAALVGWPAVALAAASLAFNRLRAEIRDVI
ncbi:MAG TPA: ABC transporter permease [Tepidisphaeraceae bacterium]|nr:ABC transporter permease [Tepidisphaeraceae bacterium]